MSNLIPLILIAVFVYLFFFEEVEWGAAAAIALTNPNHIMMGIGGHHPMIDVITAWRM